MQFKKVSDETLIELSEQGLSGKMISERTGISPAAVCKRLKRLRRQEPPESFAKLTEKQQKYVEAVAVQGMSRTNAALSAFDCSSRDSAKSIAKALDRDPDISVAISELLYQEGIGRRARISRLSEHLLGRDPSASIKAIEIASKLAGDFTEKIEIGFDTDALRRLIQSIPDQPPVINITPATE